MREDERAGKANEAKVNKFEEGTPVDLLAPYCTVHVAWNNYLLTPLHTVTNGLSVVSLLTGFLVVTNSIQKKKIETFFWGSKMNLKLHKLPHFGRKKINMP